MARVDADPAFDIGSEHTDVERAEKVCARDPESVVAGLKTTERKVGHELLTGLGLPPCTGEASVDDGLDEPTGARYPVSLAKLCQDDTDRGVQADQVGLRN